MKRFAATVVALGVAGGAITASAQPAPDAPPGGATPAPAPAPPPLAKPDDDATPTTGAPAATPIAQTGLRIHVITTHETYIPFEFDVFSVETRKVAASGTGAAEDHNETPQVLALPAGAYKIVRSGEGWDTKSDFAIATVVDGQVTDFLLVIDPDSFQFRGSGPVIEPLPTGKTIAGVRVSLSAGGTLLTEQSRAVVGTTNGSTTRVGLFGNFGLLYEKDEHLVDIDSSITLDLVDPLTGGTYPTRDLFEASALYSYKINNPYFGPYVRGSMVTRVFPGYVYFEQPGAGPLDLQIQHVDGRIENLRLSNRLSPDSLRFKVADAFAPMRIQEELGANLKAVDVNLLLFKLHVGTRIGFGFRQGITNGLLVVDGDADKDNPVHLTEIDDYNTLGPVVGAKATVTFARWLFGSAQFGLLAPLTNKEKSRSGTDEGQLLIDFSGTAGFKVPILTNLLYASADYTFRLERDAFLTPKTQFDHALMVRASVTIF